MKFQIPKEDPAYPAGMSLSDNNPCSPNFDDDAQESLSPEDYADFHEDDNDA